MSAVTITVDSAMLETPYGVSRKELGRYKIWLYAGNSAMNLGYLDGKNPKADADNQQERFSKCHLFR